ncbi:uncharacterized protein PAC_06062 [Phialocephala subalpina]|uniref:Uncharacterized protein n=1 Tax=Phialocephala subalpina TaxID=576137 RepID=A0A1L7WTR5_9HELO|nr:uncharacterized protein PAC_06062 [Phialocephala subalpina]
MSSAINTPARKHRSRHRAEYEFVPRTPGNVFSMELGTPASYGAMFFEPPRQSIQSPLGYSFGAEGLSVRDSAPWPQDALQDSYIPDSYFGSIDFPQDDLEATNSEYVYSNTTGHADFIPGSRERGPDLYHQRNHHSPQSSMMTIGNTWSSNNIPRTTPSQTEVPLANNVFNWVANSINTTLPPEITINSPFDDMPPPSHFSNPLYPPQPEPGPVAAFKVRGSNYHWDSYTSPSSERNFQTPSSSLSTNGEDFGRSGGRIDLFDRDYGGSLSTNASTFTDDQMGPTFQLSGYTPQSSLSDDQSTGLYNLSGIINTDNTICSDEGDEHENIRGNLTAQAPSLASNRPRTTLLILPAPPKNQDGVVVFGPKPPTSRNVCNQRKLSPTSRVHAKAVRDVGACLICRYRYKTTCSPGIPCSRCEKIVGHREYLLESKELTSGICIRVDLQSYRKTVPDLYDTATRTYNLPIKPYALMRKIVIGHVVVRTGHKRCVYFPSKLPLAVDVQDCEFIGHGLGRRTRWEEHSESMPSYRIDDATLPSAAKLDEWGRNVTAELSTQLLDFQPDIRDKFLFDYFNMMPLSGIHELVNLTIRMITLSWWLQGSHPTVYPADLEDGSSLFSISDGRIEQMLSPIARGQLRTIAAKGMEETEKRLLAFFDAAIKTQPDHAIIVGICLWRLAMLYRTMMKRYKLILQDARVDRRREKQKVMYEAMTTGYSLVYRGSASPYSPHWRIKDHMGTFGRNKALASTFLQLKNEEERFYEENKNDDDDSHARKLCWERITKNQKRMRV